MSPEERAARLAHAASLYVPPPTDQAPEQRPSLAPAVPVQRQPDVKGAENRLLDAALERYKLGDAGPASDYAAAETVRQVEGKPEPITTSWADAAARAFLPQRVAEDGRPMSAMELAENAVRSVPHLARQALIPTPEVAGAINDLLGADLNQSPLMAKAFGVESLDPNRNKMTPDAMKGTPTENGVLYLMRMIGTAAPAVVQESIERMPVPDIAGGVDAVQRHAAAGEIAAKFFTPSSLGEQALGFHPSEYQRVQRTGLGDPVTNWGANWAEGVLERIERGDGFERDLETAFSRKIGQDWADTGWWLGLGIDTFTDWEGALVKGPKAVHRIASAAKELGELGKGLDVASPLWAAVKSNELNAGRWLGDAIAENPDKVPAKLAARVEEVAQNEYGQSWQALKESEGLGGPPSEHQALRNAAADIPTEHLVPPRGVSTAPLKADIAAQESAHAVAVAEARKAHEAGEAGHAGRKAVAAWMAQALDEQIQENTAAVKGLRQQLVAINAELRAPPKRTKLRMGAPSAPIDDGVPLAKQAETVRAKIAETERQSAALQAKRDEMVAAKYRPPRGFVEPAAPSSIADARAQLARLEATRAGSVPLPRFDEPIYNVHDFRRKLAELEVGRGAPYQLLPGDGYRRMEGALDQAVTDPVYVLRDGRGEVQATGTYAEMLAQLAEKPRKGFEVWYGSRRPVARWGAQGLSGDFHFASDLERMSVDAMRQADPRLTRPVVATDVPRSMSETVGHVLGDQLTQAPSSSVGRARSTSRTADVIRKAVALHVRDMLGGDRLKALPNTAMVAVEDHGRILAEADRALGLNGDQAAKVIGGHAALTDDQFRRIQRFVPTLENPAQLTAKDWNVARNAAISEAAGFLADTRYRIQGSRGFADRLMLAFKDAHIPSRQLNGRALQTRGPLGWIASGVTEKFMADATARMPEAVRNVWKELRVGIETDANGLLREIRRKGGNIETALRDTMKAYALPHPEEIARAEAILTGPREAFPKLLEQLKRSWRGSDRPAWLDSAEDVVQASGLHRWAQDLQARARHIASDWVMVHAALAGKDVEQGSALYDAIRQLPKTDLDAVYREVIRQGRASGPALGKVLASLNLKPAEETTALIHWILSTRAQERMGQALDRMTREGLAVRTDDPRLPALKALLLGQHQVWNEAAQRWDHQFSEAALTWASARLRDWAILPGAAQAGTLDVLKTVPGTKLLVPSFLADEAARLVRVGVVKGSTDLTGSKLLNNLYILWKQLATHGFILPNPAHYVGQMVGLIPTLITTRGYKGASSALWTMLVSNAALTGELVKRVGGKSWPTFRPRALEASVLRTDSGMLYRIDELEDIARSFGLGESRPDFEVANQIAALMQQGEQTGPLAWQKLKQGVAWWQDHVQGFAGAFDLHGRMAVFLDEIKRGTPPEAAAMHAREAMLDFRELTPFEAQWGRLLFTFYAYMRKNSDAYLKWFIKDPARVTSQMRLAHAQLTHSGLTGIELGAITDGDIARLVLHSDREVINDQGRVHPLYKLNRVTSSPVGVGEWLGTMRMLIPGWDTRGLLQSVNPAGQALAVLLQGRKLDRDINRPWNNKIPPFLLDMPGGDLLADAVGAGPEPLTKYDDPLLADEDATQAAGVPAYWAAGVRYATTSPAEQEAQRRLWQEVSLFLSRPFATGEALAQALGGERPPPNVTQSEQLFDALLGFKHRAALNQTEAVRRFELQRESALRDAANTVRPPEGIGPR